MMIWQEIRIYCFSMFFSKFNYQYSQCGHKNGYKSGVSFVFQVLCCGVTKTLDEVL